MFRGCILFLPTAIYQLRQKFIRNYLGTASETSYHKLYQNCVLGNYFAADSQEMLPN